MPEVSRRALSYRDGLFRWSLWLASPALLSACRTRRVDATRRRSEKGRDLVDLVIGELGSELADDHHRHGLPQIPGLPRMEVRRRQRNVAQRRDLEDIFVSRRLGHHEPALVVRRQQFRAGLLDNPERRIHAAADIDAAMATRTALVHEQRQPGLLFGRKGIGLACEETIKRGVRRYQRRLKDGNGLLGIGKGDRIGHTFPTHCRRVYRSPSTSAIYSFSTPRIPLARGIAASGLCTNVNEIVSVSW